MKQVLLMIVSLVAFSGCAAYRPLNPSEMQIQKIIEIQDAPKAALYDKSRMWYASNFRSANAVIQYENKENGTIMGNGTLSDSIMMVRHTLRFSIVTEVKDGKARITATGQTADVQNVGETSVQKRIWKHFQDQIEEMINGYAGYIRSASVNAKPDNW